MALKMQEVRAMTDDILSEELDGTVVTISFALTQIGVKL